MYLTYFKVSVELAGETFLLVKAKLQILEAISLIGSFLLVLEFRRSVTGLNLMPQVFDNKVCVLQGLLELMQILLVFLRVQVQVPLEV